MLDNWSSGDLGGVACDNYRGYRDVAYSYDWAKGTGDNLVTVGTMFAIAKKYGFAGGPPYVRLMGLANDETDAGERIKPPAPVPESRWPKLTRRGRAIIEMRPAGMIVPGWLRDTGFTGILANRGTGKTVVAVGLALCIAADKKWMGEPVARGFHAIYLCGEDQENTSAHIEAWCNRNNAGEIPDRFVFIEDVPDLMNADDCAPLIAHIGSLIPSGTRAVIVADTWQRATSSARDGQNSDRDMAAAAENLEVIAKAFCGAAVACFHPPKGQKAMGAPSVHGSAVIENTSTGIWTLGVDEAGAKLEVTRIKGPGLGNYKRIRLETESLARADAFGREVTGKVAEHIGGTVSSLMDEAETERLEKEAVFRTVRVLLKGGLSVLRSNGEGQKPADVAEEVFRREGIKLDKKTVLKHLNALEREGRLIYIAADRNRRVKAGFRLPHDCTAEAADECMPKASPNAVEGIFKTQEMPAES